MLAILKKPVYARSLSLQSTEGAAFHARAVIREWLGLMHPALFEAQLVVSELVTNAFRYGTQSSEIEVCMPYICPGSCKVTVIDGGNRDSAPRMFIHRGDEVAVEGHQGLKIVQDLSKSDWGTYTLSEGGMRIVWAWVFPAMSFQEVQK